MGAPVAGWFPNHPARSGQARDLYRELPDEHRPAVYGCLEVLSERWARRSLVGSRTTLLAPVRHATSIEKGWFDEAVTGR